MSTSEPKKHTAPDEAPAGETTAGSGAPDPDETAAKPDDAGADVTAEEKARAEEPVWPPPESQPPPPEGGKHEGGENEGGENEGGPPEGAEPALLTKPDEPKPGEAESSVAKSSDAQPPESAADDAAPKPPEAAAEPGQEMTLSESTLHWLVDGELPIEPTGPNPMLAPIYDPRAPVVGRKRTVVVIGGAAVLALCVAWALHAQAAHHEKMVALAPSVGSADLLIHRAETALAQGRSAEALDLARLATVTDPHYADAYVVMGGIQRSNGQAIDARDSYRRYLELAPLGNHAAEARAALTALPP